MRPNHGQMPTIQIGKCYMEKLKAFATSYPVIAAAVVLIAATLVYHFFFSGAPLPDVPA